MTAASPTPAMSSRDMGEICAARSKVDSILGGHDGNEPGHDPRLSVTPRYDRTAMIELRRARGRWNADDLDIDYVGDPLEVETGPIEVAVLDLPSYDATESTAVRDEAAAVDRALKIARLVRSADRLRAQLGAVASEDAEPEPAIDLREGTQEQVAATAREGIAAAEIEDLQGVVSVIRKLASLRDQGVLTDAEFDAKMSDLLARV